MREAGHFTAALTHLEERDQDICDRLALMEAKGGWWSLSGLSGITFRGGGGMCACLDF